MAQTWRKYCKETCLIKDCYAKIYKEHLKLNNRKIAPSNEKEKSTHGRLIENLPKRIYRWQISI